MKLPIPIPRHFDLRGNSEQVMFLTIQVGAGIISTSVTVSSSSGWVKSLKQKILLIFPLMLNNGPGFELTDPNFIPPL